MEDNKSGKSKILIILLVLIVGVGVGFGVYTYKNLNKQVEETGEEKTPEETIDSGEIETPIETEESVVTDDGGSSAVVEEYVFNDDSNASNKNGISKDVIAKMKRFVDAGSEGNYNYTDNTTISIFIKGVSTLNKTTKLRMAYNDVYRRSSKTLTLTKDEVNKMTTSGSKDGMVGEEVSVIKITDFDNAYKTFFNETPSYSISELEKIGCPMALGINKSLDKIYLFHRCGGSSDKSMKSKILSYEKSNGYYIVHQENKLTGGNNKETTYKLAWKFDSNLRFAGTVKE